LRPGSDRKMSNEDASDESKTQQKVRKITARQLACVLGMLDPSGADGDTASVIPLPIVVVDVRGSDRPRYGWIPGSVNMPSDTLTPKILSGIADQGSAAFGCGAVVFHCLHSRHRAVWASTQVLQAWRSSPVSTPRPVVYLLEDGFKGWLETWKKRRDIARFAEGIPASRLALVLSARPWRVDRANASAAAVAAKKPTLDNHVDTDSVANAAALPLRPAAVRLLE
jgi:rhodanese-related sulfurtransferase